MLHPCQCKTKVSGQLMGDTEKRCFLVVIILPIWVFWWPIQAYLQAFWDHPKGWSLFVGLLGLPSGVWVIFRHFGSTLGVPGAIFLVIKGNRCQFKGFLGDNQGFQGPLLSPLGIPVWECHFGAIKGDEALHCAFRNSHREDSRHLGIYMGMVAHFGQCGP